MFVHSYEISDFFIFIFVHIFAAFVDFDNQKTKQQNFCRLVEYDIKLYN